MELITFCMSAQPTPHNHDFVLIVWTYLILNNNYLQFSERDTLASMRTGLLLALGLALLAGTQAQPREVNTAR